jgi:hypothetical protein
VGGAVEGAGAGAALAGMLSTVVGAPEVAAPTDVGALVVEFVATSSVPEQAVTSASAMAPTRAVRIGEVVTLRS